MIFWIIIGSSFWGLATKYGKNKWAYLGIGIGLAVGVQLLVGLLYGLIMHPTDEAIESSSIVVNLIALVVSGAVAFFVYNHLKKKAEVGGDSVLEEIEKIGEDKKEDSMEL